MTLTVVSPWRSVVPLEALSSHGSELKTTRDVRTWGKGRKECYRVPQKPVSRPTEKQVLSWLKATERATGPEVSLTAALVFMIDYYSESGDME